MSRPGAITPLEATREALDQYARKLEYDGDIPPPANEVFDLEERPTVSYSREITTPPRPGKPRARKPAHKAKRPRGAQAKAAGEARALRPAPVPREARKQERRAARKEALDTVLLKHDVTRAEIDNAADSYMRGVTGLAPRMAYGVREWLDQNAKRNEVFRFCAFPFLPWRSPGEGRASRDGRTAIGKAMERNGWLWHRSTYTAEERDAARKEQFEIGFFALSKLLSLLCCGDAPGDVYGVDFAIPRDTTWGVPDDLNYSAMVPFTEQDPNDE